MIEHILPAKAASAEAFSDPSGVWLFPEETEAVARAVDKRRREFTTARSCARQALARLGFDAVPVPRGPGGAPQWPDGVAGSITHCSGYRACAVARTRDVASVGIDAEPNEATPKGVLGAVSDTGERERLAGLPAGRGAHWDRLLFSAKESVYKAWYPLTGRWLGFEDASISIDPERESFTARLRVPGPVAFDRRHDVFKGRWIIRDGLIATAVCITSEEDGKNPTHR
ncbi:MAG: 4'-phosphopantetheinyl transferase superfamily protein [Streptosporangiales bacterium]|nr:4'-phosphopantetheinyl transferase superfamily protein [Streptosporangiales bacterium]